MDFIANATGAIYAKCWTPESEAVRRRSRRRTDVLKTVQSDYVRQVASGGCSARADDEPRRPRRARPSRTSRASRVAGPPGEGPRRPCGAAGCSSLRRSLAYAVFVLWPLVLTFKYSLYSWDGVGPSTWVGLANYKRSSRDPELFGRSRTRSS